MEPLAFLRDRLPQGPAFLLLGQDYLATESASNEFLRIAQRKFSSPDEDAGEAPSFHDLLDWVRQADEEEMLAWMRLRFASMAIPEALRIIASFHWNGVYTTSIDTVVPAAFRNEWREVRTVLGLSDRPPDPRNPARLHLTQLCGTVDRHEPEKRAPLSRQALRSRLRVADGLADRLPELVTPLGLVLIEGYDPRRDWYDLDHLAPVLEKLAPGQVHFFTTSEGLSRNAEIQALASQRIVTLHDGSLAGFLIQEEAAGHIRLGQSLAGGFGSHYLRCRDKVIAIPKEVWNSISLSARVLDESLVAPQPELSASARYREFREFVAGASGTTFWNGFGYGFAFRRDFEEDLEQRVLGRASQKQLQHHPIIVHGQTGTGKTIALGALGYRLSRNTPYPVLFIERNATPDTDTLDEFCLYLEVQGLPSTVILWDGMLSNVNEYFGLQRALIGRGRKVVVVGTSYALGQGDGPPLFSWTP